MSKEAVSSRKLIKWGSSKTLIISLPRRWVKINNLESDMEIRAVENSDGSLTLYPLHTEMKEQLTRTTIEIKDEGDLESIWLKLNTAYLDGWDEISLVTKKEFSKGIKNHVDQIISPLLGLEILGANIKEILIKDVMSIGTSNLLSLIKMVSNKSVELSDSLIRIIENPNERAIFDPQMERSSIQKYYYRIQRELRKSLQNPSQLSKMNMALQDVVDYSNYINSINDISEDLTIMIHSVIEEGFPVEELTDKSQILSLIKRTISLVKKSIDCFLFKNSAQAIEQIKISKALSQSKASLQKIITNKISSYFSEMIGKLIDISQDISFGALRRSI